MAVPQIGNKRPAQVSTLDFLYPQKAPFRNNGGAGANGRFQSELSGPLTLPAPLAEFWNKSVPGSVINTNLGPLNNFVNASAFSALVSDPNSTGGVDLSIKKDRDLGMGSKVVHKYKTLSTTKADTQVFQAQGTPVFVARPPQEHNNPTNAYHIVDPPLINYYAHQGYLDPSVSAIIPTQIDGFRQSKENVLHFYDASQAPYEFLGFIHEDRLTPTNPPTSEHRTYAQLGGQQTVLVGGTDEASVYNLFSSRTVSGDLLYYLFKEQDLSDVPFYEFSNGEVSMQNPPRIRDTVMQLRFCSSNCGNGLWFNSGIAGITDEEDWFNTSAKPREIDFDYRRKSERFDQVYRIIEPGAEEGTFFYRDVEPDLEELTPVQHYIYETGCGGLVGISKFGWNNTSPNYEHTRTMAHFSRAQLMNMGKEAITICTSK